MTLSQGCKECSDTAGDVKRRKRLLHGVYITVKVQCSAGQVTEKVKSEVSSLLICAAHPTHLFLEATGGDGQNGRLDPSALDSPCLY